MVLPTSGRHSTAFSRVALAALAVLLLAAAPGRPQEPAPEPPPPPPAPSPRNANYTIEVHLDPQQKMLEGRQILTWRNIQEAATSELWFHLYWNAWRNDRSTWMLEDRLRGRSDRGQEIAEQDWGWCRVLA